MLLYWTTCYLLAEAMVKSKICSVYQRHNMVLRNSSIVQERCSHSLIPLPLTYYFDLKVKGSSKNDKAFYSILIFFYSI